MSKIIYKELSAFHPGYYVKEILDDMEITQSEFAKRLNTTSKTLSELLAGKIDLSQDLAGKLSQMTGVPINTWLNLQKRYEQKRYEIVHREKLDSEIELLKLIDCNYFVNIGVLQKSMSSKEKITTFHSYLHVAELSALEQPDLLTACRTAVGTVNRKNVINANVWIQTGSNMAREIECKPFNEKRLKELLPYLRSLTRKPLSEACKEVAHLLAGCGIAMVALPYLRNSGLNGAVKWLNSEKAMLLLNDRRKDIAGFWFTFFHELRHIMQKKKSFVYLTAKDKNSEDILSLGRNNRDEENDADKFAQDTLVPKKEYDNFVAQQIFSVDSIRNFARDVNISEAIVLGRLQHDGYVDWNQLSSMAKSFKIVMA